MKISISLETVWVGLGWVEMLPKFLLRILKRIEMCFDFWREHQAKAPFIEVGLLPNLANVEFEAWRSLIP